MLPNPRRALRAELAQQALEGLRALRASTAASAGIAPPPLFAAPNPAPAADGAEGYWGPQHMPRPLVCEGLSAAWAGLAMGRGVIHAPPCKFPK